jgi:gas vesicle protein
LAEESKKKEPTNKLQPYSTNFAILGGLLGAGIGLLSSPETRKKMTDSFSQSEMMKAAGSEFRRTAQQMLTEQLMITLRETAASYRAKQFGNSEIDSQETSNQSDTELEEKYNELKEENQSMNEHLSRIEEKLDALLSDKK